LNLANATLQKTTPHTKNFAEYHWFREKLDEYEIKVVLVRTDLQEADIFTKGLDRNEFTTKTNVPIWNTQVIPTWRLPSAFDSTQTSSTERIFHMANF